MPKGLVCLFIVLTAAVATFSGSSGNLYQKDMADYKNNNCVSCHARLSSTYLSGRYMDWHLSAHKTSGVGCEKCHGGDSSTQDVKKAHKGILPSSNSESRLYEANLPETCGSCHRSVYSSFVESTHYQKLKSSGLGPSCITCHAHMGSAVVTYPLQGAAYCTFCHNAINGILPQRPEIPQKARRTLESITRANHLVRWLDELFEEGKQKKLDLTEELDERRLMLISLKEAKSGWHSFNLDPVQHKADRALDDGLKLKDRLKKRLGHY